MIVTCPRCASRYRIRDDKVKGRGAKISCPKCEHKFVVQREPTGVGPDDARGVPVTFARGGHPMRREVTEEDDEADVPTTVMPHGSQVAQQLRAAAEAAQSAHAARVRIPAGDRQQQYEAAVARNDGGGASSAAHTQDDTQTDDGARQLRSAAREASTSRGRVLVAAGLGLVLVTAAIVAAVIGLWAT